MSYPIEVLIVGAGLAGLTAAWRAAVLGKRVRLVAKGWGATHWHSGCIDVLGYPDRGLSTPCDSPAACVADLVETHAGHPYGLVTVDQLDESLRALQELCEDAGYPLRGSLSQNWLLPSAVGAIRPTCLAPETMIGGDLRQKSPMLIVGFRGLRDFYPGLAADNLVAQGNQARGVTLEVPTLMKRRSLTPMLIAREFESGDLADEVADLLGPHLRDSDRVGFPAILGFGRSLGVKARLEERLKRPVFEIPSAPPSIPGMRLHQILKQAITQHGGQVFDGMEVVGAQLQDGRILALLSEAAGREKRHRAAVYLLATGGILGGGIVADHRGKVSEAILELPLASIPVPSRWFKRDYFDPTGHPLYQVGVRVDRRFRPLGEEGKPCIDNLLAAGGLLANSDTLRERSHEGVAIATGYWAGAFAANHETG